MKNVRFLLLLIGIVSISRVYAQDPFFSQQNYGWSMINPAYAGSLACGRAEMGYRLQWPKLSGEYQTFNAAYDQYFKFGGIGVNYMHDVSAHVLKTDRVDVNYSYPIAIGVGTDYKSRVVIQPGIQFSGYRKSIDWNALSFGDMIDPRRGFVYNTNEAPDVSARSNFDVSAGLLVYSKRISTGLAVFHITEPDEGFFGPTKLPMRYVYHISGIFGNADPNTSGWSFIPSVIFMKQGDFQNLTGTLMVRHGHSGITVGYRNQDAIIFGASFEYFGITMAYSYDLTVSELGPTGGSHEIHFGYRFAKDKWSDEKRNLQMFF